MKRNPDPVQTDGLGVGHSTNAGARLQSRPQDGEPRLSRQVRTRAPAGVVTVGVGDHGPVHRLPGIDVEVAGFAVKSAVGEGEEGHAER